MQTPTNQAAAGTAPAADDQRPLAVDFAYRLLKVVEASGFEGLNSLTSAVRTACALGLNDQHSCQTSLKWLRDYVENMVAEGEREADAAGSAS